MPRFRLKLAFEPLHVQLSPLDEMVTVVRARVENPSDKIAFFIHLVLARSRDGEEILPVFWEDNYSSLMPGESREVTARFRSKDAGKADPGMHQIKVGASTTSVLVK